MALRQVLIDGDETLRKKSREITNFDDRLQTLIDDMFETMYASNGIGLAAPQVGVLRRLFVMDLHDGNEPIVAINPQIMDAKGTQTYQECCLSIPGRYGDVERPAELVLRAYDRNGEPFEIKASELTAVCISHENDHLDGILFKDKVKGELLSQ
ncbi:MAG: peptide deformylase [Eubacteriales bacterium]|nr:peptide deformylase [Eubacteriales bacterium]MDD3502549.1 peptide deformylase [Eubacteriales bacterium]MDD4681671.1 peptide deformylase [Eubacteriales bacterium]